MLDLIMGKLKGLVSPTIALQALVNNIETEVKHPVNKFKLIFIKVNNEIYFEIVQPDNSVKKYSYPSGETLISAIKKIASNSLQSPDLLDVVILNYDNSIDQKFVIESYFRDADTNEKLKKTFNL